MIMKRNRLLIFFAIPFIGLMMAFVINETNQSKEITGAWQLKEGENEQVLLFIDGYFTHTTYNKESRQFIQTRGGVYSIDKNKLTIQLEFDTKDKEQVGQTVTYHLDLQSNQLITINEKKNVWTRIDDGKKGLAGLWRITARQQEGNLVPIHQTGTRKTLKILTATRFQWAAVDPGTKQFMGTGGGTYTFTNGKYSENIEFFSRDSSRVGSVLTFNGKIENNDWHHSGFSSKGDPIYEVWSKK